MLSGLGHFTKFQAHLLLGARPVFKPERPVPHATLSMVDEERDRIEQSGVIKSVNYSSLAAPIIVVKKSDLYDSVLISLRV